MKFLRFASLFACASLIAACGGGGGSAGTSPFGNSATCSSTGNAASGATGACLNAANLNLQLSSTSILNTGALTVTATVTATTATGQALGGIPVSFSVDGGATFTQSNAVTDTSGKASAVVSIGADPSNRVVTVTATNGTLSKSAAFAVTGAKLTGTPVPAIVIPGSANNKVDFRLVDANGGAMVGQKITVTANGLASVDGVTGINGDFSYVYTAPATSGSLDITANAGGVVSIQTVIVQAGVNTVPVAADPSGNPAVISSASVSANPSVVATNTASTSNRTEIRALFVGPNNAPLRNVRVRFDLNGDPNSIGGTFSTGTSVVYSDANGVATTSYVPGTRASPTNGVTIRACYGSTDFTGCTTSTSTTITVASDPLSVTIGSNNVIIVGPTNLTYRRQFVILVVDASGRAKANVDIVPSLDLPTYFKGQYVHGGNWFIGTQVSAPGAIPVVYAAGNPVGCINEDANRNGVLESTEDFNHSGAIEPRKSDATITILGNGKTDENGSAVVQVEYPQNVASWLQVKILISATGVSGTEGRANWTEILPVPTSTLADASTPPFATSPYGVAVADANLNSTGDATKKFPDGTVTPNGQLTPCQNPY